MAENYNSVPQGVAGTGAAFIFNQNIATKPTAILQQQNKFNAAQKAVEERNRLAKEKEDADKWSKLAALGNPKAVISEAFSLNKQMQDDLLNATVESFKKNGGKINPQDEVAIRQKAVELESKRNAWNQMGKETEEFSRAMKGNKAFRPEYVYSKAGEYLKSTINTPENFDKQKLSDQIANDPEAYDASFLTNTFAKQYTAGMVENFKRQGRFDAKVVETFNLPVETKTDNTGTKVIVYDKFGNPKLKVTPELIMEIRKDANLSQYLDARQKRDEAAGQGRNYEDYVTELLQSELKIKTNTQLNARPQPRAAAGSGRKGEPKIETSTEWVDFSPVKDNSGKSNFVIATPGMQAARDKNGNQFRETVKPLGVYTFNSDTGGVTYDANNRNTLDIEFTPTVLVLKTKSNKILTAPIGLDAQQKEEWMQSAIRDLKGQVTVVPMATGVVIDKNSTLKDMADVISDSSSNRPSRQDRDAKATQRSIGFELNGFNRGAVPKALLPDENLKAVMKRIEGDIEKSKSNPTKAAQQSKNDILGFGASKPAAKTTTTSSKNNPLGF